MDKKGTKIMKFIKKVQGKEILMEILKIKNYGRYGLYQVYKIENNERIPLYQECYTKLDLKEIKSKGYRIEEEVFIW